MIQAILKFQGMDFSDIFQSQKEFFNLHHTKDVAFRKETLKKLKKVLKDNESRLYEAIYKDVSWEDDVMQEEIFGPVFPVISFNNYDTILQKIIEGEKPLAAYLFTKNEDEKSRLLNLVSFGGGCINDTLMHITSDYLPFGGIGNSGIGNYHGEYGFLSFSHQKSVVERTTWGEPDWKYPPYTDKKMKWLKRVM